MKKKVQTRQKTAVKTIRKTPMPMHYTYDTPMRILSEKYGFDPQVPLDTKLGDYLKDEGYKSAASLLKIL